MMRHGGYLPVPWNANAKQNLISYSSNPDLVGDNETFVSPGGWGKATGQGSGCTASAGTIRLHQVGTSAQLRLQVWYDLEAPGWADQSTMFLELRDTSHRPFRWNSITNGGARQTGWLGFTWSAQSPVSYYLYIKVVNTDLDRQVCVSENERLVSVFTGPVGGRARLQA